MKKIFAIKNYVRKMRRIIWGLMNTWKNIMTDKKSNRRLCNNFSQLKREKLKMKMYFYKAARYSRWRHLRNRARENVFSVLFWWCRRWSWKLSKFHEKWNVCGSYFLCWLNFKTILSLFCYSKFIFGYVQFKSTVVGGRISFLFSFFNAGDQIFSSRHIFTLFLTPFNNIVDLSVCENITESIIVDWIIDFSVKIANCWLCSWHICATHNNFKTFYFIFYLFLL